jgi:putative ATP-binding cassette transporter
MIQIIPVLIVAPLFIRGEAEFGVIPQASMAFAHVVGAFSLVVNQFGQLSSYAAVLARLSVLGETAETLAQPRADGVAVAVDDRRLAFERLTLRAPEDGRVLVRELSAEATAGAPLLITGSPVVLAALQRAIAGIWEHGEGRIVRPDLDQVLLLPGRPYMPGGTLRELIAGGEEPGVSEEQLAGVLRAVGLDAATTRVGGLDVERDWDDVLSLEEQRLVAVARVLVAAPRFAVLADLGATLGAERALQVLAELAARGVGVVLLGDGQLPRERFATVLAVAPDGSWTPTAAPPPP